MSRSSPEPTEGWHDQAGWTGTPAGVHTEFSLLTATVDPDPALGGSRKDETFADVSGQTDLVVVPGAPQSAQQHVATLQAPRSARNEHVMGH